MIFWIMFVGVIAALDIDDKKPASTNAIRCVLTIFCFSASIYLEFFLGKA